MYSCVTECLFIRLSYVVWMLEELANRIPSGVHAYVMYDVACTLVQHLRGLTGGKHLLECFKFALPSFHAFGHNASCQVYLTITVDIELEN